MSVNQPQERKDKLIWSSIRNRLNISLHQENLLRFLRSQEIQTILQKFLSFYTDGNKNEDFPNNLKFLSKYDVTNPMKDFMINIASCLNMTKMHSFELLDSYFSLHIEEQEKISNLLTLSYSSDERSSQRYHYIKTDLEDKKSKIIEFYFKERKNLILFFLDIFFQIFLEPENVPMELFQFMDNFLKTKNMLEVFYTQLINYENIRQIFDENRLNNRYVREIINKVPKYLCEEQNLILELIMILIHQNKYSEPKILDGLLQYFIKTQFYCQSQMLVFENNNLKDEIMIKCLLITLSSFQPDIINKIVDGENNLIQNILCFKNDFNFETILSVFKQPLNNHVLVPIKLTIEVMVTILKKYRAQINNSQQKIVNYDKIFNKQIQDKECFGFLNLIEQKIQLFEGENNIEKGLTIYDIYYDILYDWINMVMKIYYEQNIDTYEPLLYQLLFRIMSHFLPQRKFYKNLLEQKRTNITQFFNNIKQDFTKKDIFLNFCFSLSKSIEPGDNSEEYLLNILSIEPIEKLKKELEDADDLDINRKREIIADNEKDIFFFDLFDEWNNLIQLLYTYSQNQFQKSNIEILPEDLSNQINYIRLFIRAVLPSDNFSNFIFNFAYYYNMKEKNNMNENNIDEEDMNYGVQVYNPNIFKKLIFSSVTVLSLITEMQIHNKNILFGEFITELLKLFILYTKDNHFVECLKDMNYFFEKFNGKNIIFNIIENDNNTQDFSNTLYAIKFIKQMFKPEIFLQIARNDEFNTPNKLGEIFYVSNFYYIKELINHFTQINEYLNPINALLISELNETMIQIMNYLEIKNDSYKIKAYEVQSNIYDNKNLINFVIKLLMQDNKDYVMENDNQQMGNNNILLIDFIFKYLGIKINDDIVRNFNINDMKKQLFYNNLYIQQYLVNSKIQKENYNRNSSYNIGCYKKMILSAMNCLSKILSLIIIHNKQDKENKEPKYMLYKYTQINFINRLNYNLLIAKEVPSYIYESIDEKRKYHLNIILLLFFYSLYEIEKNEQLIIERNNIKNLEEEQPTDLEFFMADLKSDTHLNICTIALNNICKIIYIIKDTGISLNNNFILEKNSASEINSNVNLFKLLRDKMINILGSKNRDIDLLKIEILKLLIISTKYQFSFVRNFIQGNDDLFYSDIIFTNLNNSLKFNNNNNFNNIELDILESNFDLKIQNKTLKGELYTYVLMFISELLNHTQDAKIIENLLIKENGKALITSLINYGIHSCDIVKECDEFNKILYQQLRAQNINISDIFFISNSLKLLIDIFSIKLNIIEYLSILFKRVLLFCKQTKKIKINFEYTKELKYFIQNHIRNLVEFFAKIGDLNNVQNMIKIVQKELLINGIEIKEHYLSDNEVINKDNLEMIIQDYIYNYDFNYSFDIKEIIIKGFYDALFRDKYLKNIVLYNCFICYYYIFAQSFSQSAQLFGLIFSIGELNYLLTDKLFTNVEIYKIFKDNEKNKNIIDSYNDEINSILTLDNCYNYKLTFNPLKDLFENNENNAIKFIKDNIISRSINNIESIPLLSTNENRLYYQMLNCSLDYILYLHNKSVCNKNTISIKIDFSEFLKKIISIISIGISNNNISDNNLLSIFNLIYHIVYYIVLTENGLDSDDNDIINSNIINNENNNEKIQVIIDLMDLLILIFKKIKECRSILLYIFSCIVYIKNDLIKKSLKNLFDIILKLYTKENDSFEFHSFLLLLNRMRINYPNLLLEIMKDSQIFNFIYMKCCYNSYINLYTKKMHNSEHLIYIWTLKVFSNILNTYLTKINNELKPNYNNVISNIIKFIELIQQRFKDLFNLCSDNTNFLSGLTQNNYISLAYLEELKASIELITAFISIECDNSCPVTKDQSFLEFLFDSIDMISNTCLYLYKNGYKNINLICKTNSKVETLMLNTKIKNSDLNEDNNINNINFNNINNRNDYYSNELENFNEENIYKNMIMFNNNQKRNEERKNNNININNDNNDIDMEQLYINDKSANVFHFKVKTNLMIILFNISSCMIQLLNRQNFNLKKYLFNKYQLKEFETQLKIWPMLYLSSIKFASDFLKDIINNLKMYKILYNKDIILLNSINISLGNCFMNEIYPEYPLNELIDLILFILSDFCEINPNFNDFIELIIKNHPYINNSRAILTEVYQLCKIISVQINKYSKDFDEDDNFLGEFEDLKKNVETSVKSIRLNKN